MKLTVYIDILIVVNIIINYILIRLACIVSGSVADFKRKIISSVTGAFFSMAIFFELSDLSSVLLKIISVLLCGSISFGYGNRRFFLKNLFSLIAVNVIFSGFVMLLADKSTFVYFNNYMYYFNINPVMLVLCIFALYIIISAGELLFSTPKEQVYDFVIEMNGQEYNLTGFYDTGFGIKDIINDRAVIMCSFDTIKDMASPHMLKEIYSFFTKGEYQSCDIFPLFYGDISGKGMLPAIKAEKVYIEKNGKRTEIKNTAIAVCRQNLSDEYQIIFGKQIMKRTGS